MFAVLLIIFIFVVLISWGWVNGIENMRKNHPNYKGEDFLNWDEDKINSKTEDFDWDDNRVHTEGSF